MAISKKTVHDTSLHGSMLRTANKLATLYVTTLAAIAAHGSASTTVWIVAGVAGATVAALYYFAHKVGK